jgi:hypothetical protein
MRHTQFAICEAWLARIYRDHRNPYKVERSDTHTRYLFHFDGDPMPFYTMHTFRAEGLLREFARVGDDLKPLAVGRPFVEIDKGGSRSLVKVWNGEYWELRLVKRGSVDSFALYLNCGAVGVLWGSRCQ